jgi:hypothetical protein
MHPLAERMEQWLRDVIARHGGTSGTVHVVSESGERLELVAAHNIPEKVKELTREIPLGKGMAGLAWQRGQPVATCNLQEDRSGDVRPGAKAVGAKAAVAFPIGEPVRAVAGIAWMEERELDDAGAAAIAAEAAESFPG